jgi:hypothetical protein
MTRKYLISFAAVLALAVFGAGASSALAAESLREEKGGTVVTVGTDFAAGSLGTTVLTTSTLVVTCTHSTIGGTVTTAAAAPVLSIQSVTFGGCTEAAGNQVLVRTATPWTATWTAAKTFHLTGISAEVVIGTTVCKVANSGTEVFPLTWKNVLPGLGLAELVATKAPLAISGTGCPTSGTETATYKLSPETITDLTEKLWLE